MDNPSSGTGRNDYTQSPQMGHPDDIEDPDGLGYDDDDDRRPHNRNLFGMLVRHTRLSPTTRAKFGLPNGPEVLKPRRVYPSNKVWLTHKGIQIKVGQKKTYIRWRELFQQDENSDVWTLLDDLQLGVNLIPATKQRIQIISTEFPVKFIDSKSANLAKWLWVVHLVRRTHRDHWTIEESVQADAPYLIEMT